MFNFQRDVRQGDPQSPDLFILCMKLLSAALKAHPEIQGLVINNSEYLISQYADDSTLILGDDQKSLNMALYTIDCFQTALVSEQTSIKPRCYGSWQIEFVERN